MFYLKWKERETVVSMQDRKNIGYPLILLASQISKTSAQSLSAGQINTFCVTVLKNK